MTESFDALEAELEALEPRNLSPQLPQRIGLRLKRPTSSWKRRLVWTVVLTGGVAAGLTLAIFLMGRDRSPAHREIAHESAPTALPPPVALDKRWPTVGVYEEALAESPEAFEALLDEHARTCALSVGPGRAVTLLAPYAILPE